eukprot:scaffold12751_cov24-Attheya_sp.AAC.1
MARDATLAKMVSTPAIETTTGHVECVVRCLMARPRNKRWTIVGEFPKADMRVAQETDGVLSQ